MSAPLDVVFDTEAGPLVLHTSDVPAVDPDERCFAASPEALERIIDRRLFGLIPENLPESSPLRPGEPVVLTLRWRSASAPAPDPADAPGRMAAADWELTAVTQDFDGVQVGYRTVGDADEIGMAVMDFLAAAGWTATRLGPDEPFATTYPGGNGDLEVAIHVDERRRFLLALATLPVDVAPDRRAAVGELALRISAGMDIGSIDVDLDAGTVAVRSSADFDGVAVATAMVRNVLAAAVAQGDRYLPAFASAAQGAPVADVLAAVATLD